MLLIEMYDSALIPIINAKRRMINVIIETPKGRRNKFKYRPDLGTFELGKVLPAGAAFPFDFGFVPRTRAEDGDPLDAMVLMDEPAFPGCVVKGRLIGIIEAEQTKKSGKVIRNDRLLVVAEAARDYGQLQRAKDLDPLLLQEFEYFFASYHAMNGGCFKVLGVGGPKRAFNSVKAAMQE
jgi:inorganic pyrophosphatase